MHAARLVGAVLAPHHAVNAQFGERWHTPQRGFYAAVLIRCDAVLGEQLRGNRSRLRERLRGVCGHNDCLHCRMRDAFAGRSWDVESRDHSRMLQFRCNSGRIWGARLLRWQRRAGNLRFAVAPRSRAVRYFESGFPPRAGMAELADAADSKSAGPCGHGGSTPPPGTIDVYKRQYMNYMVPGGGVEPP